ncbi:MAG: transporter substrate-binding domain-containing protein [Magnetococcales bacterium]|nr:transporter substrate-binding domain-containing protein [Magnetococcales bacterium]
MVIHRSAHLQKTGHGIVFVVLLALFCFHPFPALAETEPQSLPTSPKVMEAAFFTAKEPPIPPGDQQKKSTNPPDIQRIVERGELIVAMYHRDTPPFYYRNAEGNMDGIDVRLITGFAKQMGVGVRFERSAKTFTEVVDRVATHQADLAISKLGMTFARAMRIRYSQPYIHLRQALLMNRLVLAGRSGGGDRSEIIRNLDGKLGVIARSSYVDNARIRFKKATIVEFDTWNEAVEAATRGEIMAAYRDEVEVKTVARDHPHKALRLLTVVLTDAKDPKAIITPWDSPNLLALVDFYLHSLDLNLTGDQILNHYDEVIEKIDSKIKDVIR